MNFREYKVTPIFFLLEAEKYERAANYILQEVFKEEISTIQPNKVNDIQNRLRNDLGNKYKSIRREYPTKITLEQMRDIAEKVYQDMCRSLPVRRN